MLPKKDIQILNKILERIAVAEDILTRATREEFLKDQVLKHAAAMVFLNIGELTKHFSKDFLKKEQRLPIHKMRGLRNIAAHEYDILRFESLWKTMTVYVPELKATIKEILDEK